ncbi:hypothetical protein TorRG33x02_100110 [Trema orientale]|uniref:Uncharacterized protein n=1 Tax=Trema orientale TaxID=63057 RepID=A0A2P5F909_TREOI|nr:hypothetical protein TorRG33x02_100110 [Trema orientale]
MDPDAPLLVVFHLALAEPTLGKSSSQKARAMPRCSRFHRSAAWCSHAASRPPDHTFHSIAMDQNHQPNLPSALINCWQTQPVLIPSPLYQLLQQGFAMLSSPVALRQMRKLPKNHLHWWSKLLRTEPKPICCLAHQPRLHHLSNSPSPQSPAEVVVV